MHHELCQSARLDSQLTKLSSMFLDVYQKFFTVVLATSFTKPFKRLSVSFLTIKTVQTSELKLRDRPQPLSGNPQGFDAVFFSGGNNQTGECFIIATERRPNNLTYGIFYLWVRPADEEIRLNWGYSYGLETFSPSVMTPWVLLLLTLWLCDSNSVILCYDPSWYKSYSCYC